MTDPLVTDYLQARAERDKAQAHLDEVSGTTDQADGADQRKSFRWKEAVRSTCSHLRGRSAHR
jgi:hypothetical protein